MKDLRPKLYGLLAFAGVALPLAVVADDWPQWGGTPARNMVSPSDAPMPLDIKGGKKIKGSEDIDPATTKGVKWITKIGSQSYGTPTIADGKILVGTNNETPRDPKHVGDRGVLMCFNESDGELLWQLVVPKLGAGKVSDWEFLGICSSAAVEGDRCYIVTNRGEVVCLDMAGQANGNDGLQNEGAYMAGPGKPPLEIGKLDADIIWSYDMRAELGVFPHNITSSSPLIADGKLFVTTSNGVDWSHTNIPAPQAPALIALDLKTGELLGEEGSGISQNIMHCNWSSPAYGEIKGKPAIIFAAGDGFCYAFDPVAKEDEEGFLIFPEIWKFDCNLPEYRVDEDGNPIKYATFDGASECIATPVVDDGKVYISIGQDPEHGEGVGRLSAIDIETGMKVWDYTDIERSLSTASVAPNPDKPGEKLVYVADYRGRLHCVDAKNGRKKWIHDTKSHIWGSTLVADDKVYLGNEDGELAIVDAGQRLKGVWLVEFTAPIYAGPVAANGVLYICTQSHLYAFEAKK
ncbi:MAG: PQQ-binding-like beta-propeller repeat protein [Verrucomicrobiales bacterium]